MHLMHLIYMNNFFIKCGSVSWLSSLTPKHGCCVSPLGWQWHNLEWSSLVRCRSPSRGLCHWARFQSSHRRTEGWYENNAWLWYRLCTGLGSGLCYAGGPVSFILMAPSGFSHKNLWGYQQASNRLLVNVLTHRLKGRKKPEQQVKSLFQCYLRILLLPSAGPAHLLFQWPHAEYFFSPWWKEMLYQPVSIKFMWTFFPPSKWGRALSTAMVSWENHREHLRSSKAELILLAATSASVFVR